MSKEEWSGFFVCRTGRYGVEVVARAETQEDADRQVETLQAKAPQSDTYWAAPIKGVAKSGRIIDWQGAGVAA